MTADLSPHDARLSEDALEAAARLFAQHGVHGLGMAEISREITRRTETDILEFRRSFPTRLDLVYAVALHATRALVNGQTAEPATGESPSVVTAMSRLVRRHIEFCWEHRTEEEIRRDLLPTLRSIDPTRYRELSEPLRAYREHIGRLIERGAAEGVFGVTSPTAAATTVLETLESILNWYDPEGGLSVPELGDVYVDLIVHHQLGCPRD